MTRFRVVVRSGFEDQRRLLDFLEERVEVMDPLLGLHKQEVQLLEVLEGGAALLRHRLDSLKFGSTGDRRAARPSSSGPAL